ncbi:MAG: cupredoxin domain-containing protein [Thermoleophilia bacterium]
MAGGIAAVLFATAGGAGTTAAPVKIKVAASEFKFVLSSKKVAAGSTVEFTVVNKGKIPHDFKISGKKTKTLKPGQTATLKVTFPKKGLVSFICTLPGHEQGGMKGKFGVGVAAPAPAPAPAPGPTPVPTPAGDPSVLLGDPVAGKSVYATSGCGNCHTLAAAGSNGSYGPNLDTAKPSQAKVRAFVSGGSTSGGISMPSFNLSQEQLNNIASFVYVSTR